MRTPPYPRPRLYGRKESFALADKLRVTKNQLLYVWPCSVRSLSRSNGPHMIDHDVDDRHDRGCSERSRDPRHRLLARDRPDTVAHKDRTGSGHEQSAPCRRTNDRPGNPVRDRDGDDPSHRRARLRHAVGAAAQRRRSGAGRCPRVEERLVGHKDRAAADAAAARIGVGFIPVGADVLLRPHPIRRRYRDFLHASGLHCGVLGAHSE